MDLDEAIRVLQAKLAHVTRDYRPEDQAFDVLRKAALAGDPVIAGAYRRDHEKAVRQVALAAERHTSLKGLSPESAINHLAFLLDQAQEAERQQWLPIDQAPRNGSEIWAFNGEQGRMKWIEGKDYALWVWADELLSDVDPSPEQPTHFRSLPESPEVE